jgi:hypothetical protein
MLYFTVYFCLWTYQTDWVLSAAQRCADGYLVQLRNSKWVDMWSWEPGFTEPILLLLLDSNSVSMRSTAVSSYVDNMRVGPRDHF